MVSSLRPTAAFARVSLDLVTISAGAQFGRIYFDRYPNPLGFGKTPSRFSDPRRRMPENQFGVLYLGESLKVCFLEALLRDKRNGAIGDYPLDETELHTRRFAIVEIAERLSMVNLRGDGSIRMGVPSDVSGASRHSLSRAWSAAFYDHPARPEGIIYSSRLNGQTNLAVYDRATTKLRVAGTMRLIDAPVLPAVLDQLLVALVP